MEHQLTVAAPAIHPKLLILLLLHLPLLLLSAAAAAAAATSFVLRDNYLLACGAKATVLDDGRVFHPDSSFSLTARQSSSLSSSFSSSPLQLTARFFPRSSSYSFTITSKGPHLLRLHFYPFYASPRNLSAAIFDVSASGFPLLNNFSTSSPTLKEFFLNINVPALELTLTPSLRSFAFLNALELFSIPADIVPDSATPVATVAESLISSGLSAQVLETLQRSNVGGATVTPSNDTLWRTWLPDDPFLETHGSLAKAVVFPGRIDYQDGGATREAAPDSVYGTAREMNRLNNSSGSNHSNFFNLSWAYPVPRSEQGYLVRLHFCDIVSVALNELYFDVYINGYLACKDLDLSAQSGESLASPYYIDFVLGSSSGGSGSIRVSVGPSDRSLPSKINAILNGLEIMRIHGVATFSEKGSKKMHVGVVIGLVLGAFCAVLLLVIILLLRCRRRRKQRPQSQSQSQESAAWSPSPVPTGSSYIRLTELTSASPSPVTNLNLQLKIPFSEILFATKNFDGSCQIGFGGFGKVYKGVLRDGTEVAVKRGVRGSQQGLGEFRTEIVVLSKIRHRHLVWLIGYCEEQSEMILVYEFMKKGPLRDHLYGSGHPPLSWKQRLEICIGAARGLHYLHTGSSQGIIHRDVKSSNILLDENYDAKVADFGLSRLGSQTQNHVSTSVKGSFGYLDPEYFKTQQLTDKSDVYSFGVVLLEALCARPAIDSSLPWDEVNLAEWGMKWQKKGRLERIVDPILEGEIDPNSLRKFGETADKCLAQYGVDRPTMGEVLWNLEYVLQLHETAVYREAHEDSSNAPSEVSLPSARQFPSTVTGTRVDHSMSVAHEQSSVITTSQVFSQLMTNDGR